MMSAGQKYDEEGLAINYGRVQSWLLRVVYCFSQQLISFQWLVSNPSLVFDHKQSCNLEQPIL